MNIEQAYRNRIQRQKATIDNLKEKGRQVPITLMRDYTNTVQKLKNLEGVDA